MCNKAVLLIPQIREQESRRAKKSAIYNLRLAADDDEDSGGYERDKRIVHSVDGETIYNDGSGLSAIRHRADGSNRGDWQPGDASMPSSRSEGAHTVDQGRLWFRSC